MIVCLQETKKKTQSHRGKGDLRMEAEVVEMQSKPKDRHWLPEAPGS